VMHEIAFYRHQRRAGSWRDSLYDESVQYAYKMTS
jgi:hypothetical protein